MKKLKPRYLINRIALIIFAFLMLGCFSRKVETHKKRTETEVSEEVKETKEIKEENSGIKTDKTISHVNEITETSKENSNKETDLSVTIEPDKDGWSVYEFVYGDKVIKGSTKGTITFSNKTKTDSTKTVERAEKISDYVKSKDSIYNSKKDEATSLDKISKSKTLDTEKDKTSDKKEPIWSSILVIGGILALTIVIYLILKRYGIVK